MAKGKRYGDERKLNYKKVFGVLVGLVVFVMMIITIINLARGGRNERQEAVSFFSSYTNGKWGIINSLGEVVIEHTYDEMIVVPNHSRAVFVVTYDVDDEEETYRTKVINERGNEIITGFNAVSAIDNFDLRQNIWFEDNVLRVRNDEKYGLVNFVGEEILPLIYDEITALRGITSNFLVESDGQVGLVNESGVFIIPVRYAEIFALREGDRSLYVVVDNERETWIS
ncbi:MAG: WG repeat-containing protein [Oscillospiraceae bacterium]|nr:WG repeat-containing protein [Oscillospiraceae bacterium]